MLYLAPETIALDARCTCVYDVSNAWNGERGFGDVGRQHDAPAAVTVENPVLLGLTQAGEQRQHFGIARQRLMRQVLAQMVSSLANLALAGQKNQDVAGAVRIQPELVDRIGNRVVQVVVARLFKWAIALLDREHPARHHDDRCLSFTR